MLVPTYVASNIKPKLVKYSKFLNRLIMKLVSPFGFLWKRLNFISITWEVIYRIKTLFRTYPNKSLYLSHILVHICIILQCDWNEINYALTLNYSNATHVSIDEFLTHFQWKLSKFSHLRRRYLNLGCVWVFGAKILKTRRPLDGPERSKQKEMFHKTIPFTFNLFSGIFTETLAQQ